MAEETKACPEEETEKQTEPAAKAEDKKKKKEKAEKIPKADYDRLQAEFDSHKQQHLRVLAEYDNFRKRSQNEKSGVYNNAIPMRSTRFCRWPTTSTARSRRRMPPRRICARASR